MAKQLLWAFVGLGVIAGCGVDGDDSMLLQNSDREILIEMADFEFGADEIGVRAGDTVTFVLDNVGTNAHEFMIGRNLAVTAAGEPNGFEHDFFESNAPVVDPANAGMLMGAMDPGMDMGDAEANSAMDPGMDMGDADANSAMDPDPGMDMADADANSATDVDVHSGYMVVRQPTESARLTVTIPIDAVGVWQIGCFRDRGAHWTAGMQAQLIVSLPPGLAESPWVAPSSDRSG